jgi:hypothetical protein
VPAPTTTGDNCSDPFVVDALPFLAADSTTSALPDYGYGSNTCPGETSAWGAGSNDHAYAFTPDVSDDYLIELHNTCDSNLYVVTDCDNINTQTCLGADEQICSNCTESLTLSLTAGMTYFIIVDGFSSTSNQAGNYTLEVSSMVCTPVCDGLQCGDDGCGGSCGACVDPQICELGQCVDTPAPTGDTCDVPLLVDTLPFEHVGFTTEFSYTLLVTDITPAPSKLTIHELLADPHSETVLGDANCDDVRDAGDDEFFEFVNTGGLDIDLSLATVADATATRHTFADGTVLAPGQVLVLYGGGAPHTGTAGQAWCAALPANVQTDTAGTGALALNNTGDTVTVSLPSGVTLLTLAYGSSPAPDADQSLVRSPEITGDFTHHGSVLGTIGLHSPGFTADGNTITLP